MKIEYGKQVDISEIIDIFLFAANHEKRTLTCYNRVKKTNSIQRVISLCYNLTDCSLLSAKFLRYQVQDHNEIYQLLNAELANIKKEKISIVVDYSCMTKSWYYSIILYLSKKA